MAAKYSDYQWQFSDGRNKRLSDMSEDELREALALSLDLFESMTRLTDKMTDRLSLFAQGRYADDQED